MRHLTWSGLLLSVAVSSSGAAQVTLRTYQIDPEHSSITFSVPFMGIGSVHGQFEQFRGGILLGPTPEQSLVEVAIDTRSISTRVKARDQHLRSPDFLAADSFPSLTFYSTRIERSRGGYLAHGELMLRGIRRRIVLPFTQLHAAAKDAWGNSRITFKAAMKLSRADYNIRGTSFWNNQFNPGRFAMGDSVTVAIEVSAIIPNAARWAIPKTDSLVAVVESKGVADFIASVKPTDELTDAQAFTTAYKLLQRGRTDIALRLFEWAITKYKSSPILPTAATVVGDAYMQMGNREAALHSFRMALAADPHDPIASVWLRHLQHPR